MVRRPDLVLAAIPALALGGVVLQRLAALLATDGVAQTVRQWPLPTLGLVGALAVICYAVFVVPTRDAP